MDIYSNIPPILIAAFAALFFFITWFRFHWAVFLLFLLLPSYLLRFRIGPIPSTFLEIMVLEIILVWGIRKMREWRKKSENIQYSIFNIFTIGTALFLIAATISIFTAVDIRAALGEWRAFYLEPILLFFVLLSIFKKGTRNKEQETAKSQYSIFNISAQGGSASGGQYSIVLALILSGLATSILAIFQHFTGWMVPYDFWEKGNSFRVTGWYGFPNGVGLYLAPIVPLALGIIYQSWNVCRNKGTKNKEQRTINFLFFVPCSLFLLTAPLAIFYAKSTGALIGVAAGIATLLVLYKKTRWPAIIIGVIGLASIAGFDGFASIKQEILFQDRSGQIRLSMWAETWELLKDHPIRGAGLASYEERIAPYHTQVNGENIEIFHHPHNLFLTIWVNTGLLGLIGFIGIIVSCIIYQITRIKKNGCSFLQQTFFAAFITILVMGLVDSPYIKNDWAIIFWAIAAMIISHSNDHDSPQTRSALSDMHIT